MLFLRLGLTAFGGPAAQTAIVIGYNIHPSAVTRFHSPLQSGKGVFSTQVNDARVVPALHPTVIRSMRTNSNSDQFFVHKLGTPLFAISSHNWGRMQNPAAQESHNGRSAVGQTSALH